MNTDPEGIPNDEELDQLGSQQLPSSRRIKLCVEVVIKSEGHGSHLEGMDLR